MYKQISLGCLVDGKTPYHNKISLCTETDAASEPSSKVQNDSALGAESGVSHTTNQIQACLIQALISHPPAGEGIANQDP